MQSRDFSKIRRAVEGRLNTDAAVRGPRCGQTGVHVSVEKLSPEETNTKQGGCAVVFAGECGHTWADIYAEHKGETVWVPALSEWTPLEEED